MQAMETVIVVHGLWMPGFETSLLRRRLRAAGFDPVLFRFPTVSATLSENAARLGRFAEEMDRNPIHYVGHSLGGVLAAEMVETHRPATPGRIVCLGSPLNGSQAGRILSRLPFCERLVGRSIGELNDRGGLPPWAGERDLGVIAGSRGFGAGMFLGPLPRPNDGTVTVEETELEGATDHIVVPVTHTTLVLSAEVARRTIAFLRSGRFRADAPV